jgi:hypothetical protein
LNFVDVHKESGANLAPKIAIIFKLTIFILQEPGYSDDKNNHETHW